MSKEGETCRRQEREELEKQEIGAVRRKEHLKEGSGHRALQQGEPAG